MKYFKIFSNRQPIFHKKKFIWIVTNLDNIDNNDGIIILNKSLKSTDHISNNELNKL